MSARHCSICVKVSLWVLGADVDVMVWCLLSCVVYVLSNTKFQTVRTVADIYSCTNYKWQLVLFINTSCQIMSI